MEIIRGNYQSESWLPLCNRCGCCWLSKETKNFKSDAVIKYNFDFRPGNTHFKQALLFSLHYISGVCL